MDSRRHPGGGLRILALRGAGGGRSDRQHCHGRLRQRLHADRLAAMLRDILGQHRQHRFRLADHVLVARREPLDQVLRQGEFRGQRGAAQQVGVGGVPAAGGVVRQDSVHKVLVVGRDQPGHVVGRVPDAQVRPAGHGGDPVAVDQDVVLVEVAVHHAWVEAPQRYVLQRVFPAAQQQRRDFARGRGLVQFVEPPLAELVRRVTRQVGVADQGMRKVVDGGEGGAQFAGQRGRCRR